MYLLNDALILKYVNMGKGVTLDIEPFQRKCLQSNWYYFRLGHFYETREQQTGEWKPGKLTTANKVLLLEPHAYVMVKSLERFYLSEKIMAFFGQPSEFIPWGIELVHSPFIDPLFDGNLDLGISNRLSEPTEIELGSIIGKIKFFDISDTYPIQNIEGSLSEKKFQSRKEFRDDEDVPPWDDSLEPYPYDWRRR